MFCSRFCCGLVPDHFEALLDVQFTSLSSSESGSIIRALTGTGANGGDCETLKYILWHIAYHTHLPWVLSRSLCWRLRVISQYTGQFRSSCCKGSRIVLCFVYISIQAFLECCWPDWAKMAVLVVCYVAVFLKDRQKHSLNMFMIGEGLYRC